MLELLLLSEAMGAGTVNCERMVCPALSRGHSVSPCLYLPEVNAAATVIAGSCCEQNNVAGRHFFLQAFLLKMKAMGNDRLFLWSSGIPRAQCKLVCCHGLYIVSLERKYHA